MANVSAEDHEDKRIREITTAAALERSSDALGYSDTRKVSQAAKDHANKEMALSWIGEVTGVLVAGNFPEVLYSGEVLCNLLNCFRPGLVARVNKAGKPFRERENISNFLKACRELGVHDHALFCTNDLYENKNLHSVIQCIHALGGAVQLSIPEFHGPHLGVADTSSTLRAARRSIGLATQTGGTHVATDRTVVRLVDGAEVESLLSVGSLRRSPPPPAVVTTKTLSDPKGSDHAAWNHTPSTSASEVLDDASGKSVAVNSTRVINPERANAVEPLQGSRGARCFMCFRRTSQ